MGGKMCWANVGEREDWQSWRAVSSKLILLVSSVVFKGRAFLVGQEYRDMYHWQMYQPAIKLEDQHSKGNKQSQDQQESHPRLDRQIVK